MQRTKEAVSVMAPGRMASRKSGEEKREQAAPFPRTEKTRHPRPVHRGESPPPAFSRVDRRSRRRMITCGRLGGSAQTVLFAAA